MNETGPIPLEEARRRRSKQVEEERSGPRDTPPRIHGQKRGGLEIIWPPTLQGVPLDERPWIVQGWIPDRAVTMLNGDGGVGKSLIALQLMAAVAAGKPWLGRAVKRVKAIGLFCEDDRLELHHRLDAIRRHYGVEFGDLEDMEMISRAGSDNVLAIFPEKGPNRTTQLWDQLKSHAKDFGAQLVIIDTVADTFAGNENWRTHARTFVNLLRGLALELDGAVLLTAHPSNAGMATGTGLSGNTAWNASVRSRLYLTRPATREGEKEDADARVLRRVKSNYAGAGSAISMRWRDGVLVADDPPTGVIATATRQGAVSAFLECLRALKKQGRPVSHSRAANNYAPTVMVRMTEAAGRRRADIEAAMERLFATNKIKVGTYSRGQRHACIVLADDEPEAP